MDAKEMKWLYETILSGPGMGESIKLNFVLNRKLVLVLAEIIEFGLQEKKGPLINCMEAEQLNELISLRNVLLEKSDLLQLSEQLGKNK